MRTRTVFEILGILPTNDFVEVERAYHARALLIHPDKQPQEKKKEATAAFQALGAAYEMVDSPEKLASYYQDVKRAQSLSAASTRPANAAASSPTTATSAAAFFAQRRAAEAAAETPETTLERGRRAELFSNGFRRDLSKTEFVEIFIPVDIVEMLDPIDSNHAVLGIHFVDMHNQLPGRRMVNKEFMIGAQMPPYHEEYGYEKTDPTQYRQNGIKFELLATALTEMSRLSHLQFGRTPAEALTIAKNRPGDSVDYHMAIVKICVPAHCLSTLDEDVYACAGMMPPLHDKTERFKAPIFAKGSLITSNQIEKVTHLKFDPKTRSSEYSMTKTMKLPSTTFPNVLAGTTASNPQYTGPAPAASLPPMTP